MRGDGIKRAGGLALLLACGAAQADWAGLGRFGTVAELAVEAGTIRLDLRLTRKALPDAANLDGAALAAYLPQLADGQGGTLAGKLLAIEHSADGYEAHLSYAAEAGLKALRIAPPPGPGTETGLVVLHRGVPVADLAPLQKPLSLALDWDNPWRSHFDDPALIRRHAEPRSYLYVEPYEVRHELLLRLTDLSLELGLKDPRHIEDAEREAVRRKIGAFLLGRNPLRIDGAEASPQLDRVEFVRFSRTGVSPITEPGRLDTDTVLVGVVLAYLTEQPARELGLRWDLFAAAAVPRPVSVIQGPESFDAYVSPKQPEFAWTQEEALEPAPAAIAEAEPPPGLDFDKPEAEGLDEAQGRLLLQALLHNAYRAFQLRDEEKAYDRLAKSLDGELLDTIYLQQRLAILRQAEGLGGEGKVNRIEVLDSRFSHAGQDPAVWQVSSRWLAHGTVSHWGHAHERHNLYQARLSLRKQGGQWKIVSLEFLGGQRLAPGAS